MHLHFACAYISDIVSKIQLCQLLRIYLKNNEYENFNKNPVENEVGQVSLSFILTLIRFEMMEP